MSIDNPDEPPKYIEEAVVATTAFWRQGDLLVVREWSVFPERCPMTDEPATTRYVYEFSTITTSLKVVLFLIHAHAYGQVNEKKHYFHIPLADRYVFQLRLNAVFGGLLSFAGIAMLFSGFVLGTRGNIPPAAFGWIGFSLALLGMLWLLFTRRELTCHYANDTHLWLAGADPMFLARLPEWTGERR